MKNHFSNLCNQMRRKSKNEEEIKLARKQQLKAFLLIYKPISEFSTYI
jgi:hypothetical protein